MRPSMGLFPTPHHHATLITLDCNVLHHLEALANEIVARFVRRTEQKTLILSVGSQHDMRCGVKGEKR